MKLPHLEPGKLYTPRWKVNESGIRESKVRQGLAPNGRFIAIPSGTPCFLLGVAEEGPDYEGWYFHDFLVGETILVVSIYCGRLNEWEEVKDESP
jgi:hypothetical protein